MGDIKKELNNSNYENQLINILRGEEPKSKKQFKLKGPTNFLFSNFAMLALAACGGGGGGGGSTPAPTPNTNNAPNMGANASFSFTEDTAASFGIGAPTDADGDTLTITVTSIPTGGVLSLSDGTVLSAGDTLTIAQLDNITFTPNDDVNSDADTIGDLVLTVTDGQGGSDSATYTFVVSAVNDAPTDISIAVLDVDENLAGAVIGTVSFTDVDSDSVSFTLSGTDASLLEITSEGVLKLKDGVSLDFDSINALNITITATDPDGATLSKSFAISVNNVSIPETISGTVVDGYVSGSTVKVLDLNGSVIAETTTNALGQYVFNLDDSNGVKVVAEGGVDTLTGEVVTVTLTASKDSKYVSALTTIVDAAGEDAVTVLSNLGLPSDFDLTTSNPLADLEAQKINASLINIMAVGEALLEGSGLTDGAGDELIAAQIVNSLKTSTDINSATAIKTILDSTIANVSDEVAAKATSIAQAVAESISNSNTQILKAGSISQIASYQKAVLDDENSLIASVFTSLTNATSDVS